MSRPVTVVSRKRPREQILPRNPGKVESLLSKRQRTEWEGPSVEQMSKLLRAAMNNEATLVEAGDMLFSTSALTLAKRAEPDRLDFEEEPLHSSISRFQTASGGRVADTGRTQDMAEKKQSVSVTQSSWNIRLDHRRIHVATGLDILSVCNRLVSALECKQDYKQIVSQKGQKAQSWLILLRQLLDCSVDVRTRSLLSQALIRLSRNTNLYPDCLVLSGLDTKPYPMAAGSFGDVYKGILLDQSVSVKVIRIFQDPEIEVVPLHAFYRESIVWSLLRHPNILPLYGTFYFDKYRSRLCLVSPWMDFGNVVQFLRKYPDADRLLLALDVAQGIGYLHENNIIHGDLKGVNILVTPAQRACITDFGLSNISDTNILRWTSLATSPVNGGTARWQAPEILKGGNNSRPADIYSFACVCYEMFAGHHPFPDLRTDPAVVYKVMIEDGRPTRPQSSQLIDKLWRLMEDCWRTDPDDRPSAESAVSRFKEFPELMHVDIVASDWDDSFPRILQSSLRDESLIWSLQELKSFFTDGEDNSGLSEIALTKVSRPFDSL